MAYIAKRIGMMLLALFIIAWIAGAWINISVRELMHR
jgi:hypothetical protein